MILEILFVVVMLLWGLAEIPAGPGAQYPYAPRLLAFVAVLLLGLFIFLPSLR